MTRVPTKKPVRKKERDINKLFGQAVRAKRLELEMTQAALAYASGLSQTKLPAIETGSKQIRLSTADKIAQGLSVSLKSLLPD